MRNDLLQSWLACKLFTHAMALGHSCVYFFLKIAKKWSFCHKLWRFGMGKGHFCADNSWSHNFHRGGSNISVNLWSSPIWISSCCHCMLQSTRWNISRKFKDYPCFWALQCRTYFIRFHKLIHPHFIVNSAMFHLLQEVNRAIREEYLRRVFESIQENDSLEELQPGIGSWWYLGAICHIYLNTSQWWDDITNKK